MYICIVCQQEASISKSPSGGNLAGNKEKVKTWIRDQAEKFASSYFSNNYQGVSGHPALNVLNRLTCAIGLFDKGVCMISRVV